MVEEQEEPLLTAILMDTAVLEEVAYLYMQIASQTVVQLTYQETGGSSNNNSTNRQAGGGGGRWFVLLCIRNL